VKEEITKYTLITLGTRHRTKTNKVNNTTHSGKSLVGERGNNKMYTNNIRY
jgi:hypothetical protein